MEPKLCLKRFLPQVGIEPGTAGLPDQWNYSDQTTSPCSRALDKREYLVTIRDNFC